MARLPKYEPSVSLPTNVVTPDFGAKSGLAELGQRVGKVLQERGAQLVKEYDTVKAVSAYNEFYDASREMVSGLTQLESGAAEGVQDTYKEWYGKNLNDFFQKLNSQPQQTMFKNMADQRREVDLNTLARHEAGQYKIQKKESLDGFASATDSSIRSAVATGLKKPVPDFIEVDANLESFMAVLEQEFPGHDLSSLKAKYTQTFRVAQLEEMMEIDPQAAREYLETYKDDLSYVTTDGNLKDAYPALKRKLKEETTRDNVDRAYHALTTKYPTDPGECIKALYDENIMKDLGIDVVERDRLVSTFKSEITWAKQQLEFERKERSDNERKQIFELMQQGNMKSALDMLDQSESFNADEQTKIWSVINTRMSHYTDWDKYEQINHDIDNNIITKPSEITMYDKRGLSDAETRQLVTRLKEHQENPAATKYISLAFEWYDEEFTGNAVMEEMKPFLRSWLLEQVHDPKQNLKGPAIIKKLREEVGTKDDLYSKGWFDWGVFGGSWFGAGEETSRAPVGQTIESMRVEREKGTEQRKSRSKPVKSEFAPDSLSDIPDSARLEIERILKKKGYAINDKNILKVYQKNKDKLPESSGRGVSGTW